MRRILSFVFSVLLTVPFYAKTDDPVVIKAGGYDVKKSEFEYFFRKNNSAEPVTKKTVREYAELYLNFKLKVQAAVDAGLDKSESFLSEYKMYRDMQAEEYLIDTLFLEDYARHTYDESVKEIGPDGLAYLHLIALSPENESEEAFNETADLMISIYEMLQAGQDFAALARKYSQDPSAADGGEIGWMSRGQVPGDVADIIATIDNGQFCKPFVSDGSFFIIKVDRRRQLGSYQENRPDIYQWMQGQPRLMQDARRSSANKYAERLGWDLRDDAAVAHLDSVLEDVEPEFGNISREYHDGLLLFDISNQEVWEKASDTEKMEAYFKSHVKDYKFSEPCFKGMVFFCLDESVFRNVESALKGLEMENWVDTILSFNREKLQLRVMRGSSESGIFKKGQNAYVDKIVFGTGDFEPMKGFPYTNVIGKTLNEPESMNDVISEVSDDYQNYLEDEWVKELRKKYKHKIYKRALKEVKP